MLNSLKYAFAAVSSALAGGYVISQSQPTEMPRPEPTIPMALASFETEQDLDKKVTLNVNGSFADVVNWMKGQGINFVIADESAAKTRIALNFQNRPLREVINAIAKAMGGSWEKDGDTFVFQPQGRNPFFGMQTPGLEMKDFKWESMPKIAEGFKWDGKVPDFKVWVDGKEMDWKQLEKDGKLKFLKEGDFKMPAMPDMKAFPDMKFFDGQDGSFQFFSKDGKEPKIRVWIDGKEVKPEELKGKKVNGKDMKVEVDGHDLSVFGQRMSEEMLKQSEEAMAHARKNLDMYRGQEGRKLTDKERKEVEAAMKGAQAEMKRAREEVAKAMQGVDKAKIEKEIAEAMKGHEKAMKVDKAKIDKQIAEAMKAHEKAMKEHKGLSDKQRAEIEKELKQSHEEMAKAHKEMAKEHMLHAENMKKLLDSITPAQWELQKKRGYLKLSDLTATQRALINVKSADDSLTLSYSIDGKKLVIKGQ